MAVFLFNNLIVYFTSYSEFPEVKNFALHQDQNISSETSQVLSSQHHMSDNWAARHNVHPETEDVQLKKAVKDCIFRFKLRRVMKMSQEVERDMELNLENEEMLDALMKEKMALDKAKTEIAKYFGSVIV